MKEKRTGEKNSEKSENQIVTSLMKNPLPISHSTAEVQKDIDGAHHKFAELRFCVCVANMSLSTHDGNGCARRHIYIENRLAIKFEFIM